VVGFVEDHDFRIGDQRHRRHQPLQLATGNLMGIAAADRLGARDRKRTKQPDGLRHGLRLAGGPVNQCAFDHLRHDHARGVEGGGCALRDVGDAAAAQGGERLCVELRHLGSTNPDRSAGNPAAVAGIPHHGEGNGGLARTGLADQAHHFAALHSEADALDDLALRAVAGRSGNAQIADIDQGFHHIVPSRRPNSPSIVRFTAIVRLAMASAGIITAGAP